MLVVGAHEHDGIHHFVIRQPHGGSYQVPDWMFDPAASTLAIVAVPRLPVSQLVLLRALVDHLVAYPLENAYSGGIGDEEVVSHANGSVHLTAPTAGVSQRPAPESCDAFAGTADRSDDESGLRYVERQRREDRQ